jgi:hypothetical protein
VRYGWLLQSGLVVVALSSGLPGVARAEIPGSELPATAPFIAAGQQVSATVPPIGGRRYWRLELKGQQQVAITSSATDGCAVFLADETADDLDIIDLAAWTTPWFTHIYFMEATSSDQPCQVSFTVGPASAGGPDPLGGARQPTREPNEDGAHAIGPLGNDIAYAGDQNSANDQDWFYMYAEPRRTMELDRVGGGGITLYHDGYDYHAPVVQQEDNASVTDPENAAASDTSTFNTGLGGKILVHAEPGGGPYAFALHGAGAIVPKDPTVCAVARRRYAVANSTYRLAVRHHSPRRTSLLAKRLQLKRQMDAACR